MCGFKLAFKWEVEEACHKSLFPSIRHVLDVVTNGTLPKSLKEIHQRILILNE